MFFFNKRKIDFSETVLLWKTMLYSSEINLWFWAFYLFDLDANNILTYF